MNALPRQAAGQLSKRPSEMITAVMDQMIVIQFTEIGDDGELALEFVGRSACDGQIARKLTISARRCAFAKSTDDGHRRPAHLVDEITESVHALSYLRAPRSEVTVAPSLAEAGDKAERQGCR